MNDHAPCTTIAQLFSRGLYMMLNSRSFCLCLPAAASPHPRWDGDGPCETVFGLCWGPVLALPLEHQPQPDLVSSSERGPALLRTNPLRVSFLMLELKVNKMSKKTKGSLQARGLQNFAPARLLSVSGASAPPPPPDITAGSQDTCSCGNHSIHQINRM